MNRHLILFVILLIGGCSKDSDDASAGDMPDASLPGVYAGVFPCDGCPGIAATLWLRADGRFFSRLQYPEDDTHGAADAYSLGRWNSIADDRSVELKGEGPRRIFARPDRDTLIMQTDSTLEHRLTRDATAPEFSATIRMAGMMRMRGEQASFTECLAGFVAPVSKRGDFARFRHQYRSAARSGEPAYVELEGRFSWSDDLTVESLTIERFITVKAEGAC